MKTFTGIKYSENRQMQWKQHENTEKKRTPEQNDKENWRGGKSWKTNEQVR
jgi:hypothetical protein